MENSNQNKESNIITLNIYQRMIAIMNEVKYLQKTEKAAKGLPYKFVSHDMVTGSLHNLMVKYGVFTKTDVVECTQEGNRTIVKVVVSFINVDDPNDMFEVSSYGYGIDMQDKGVGKAISYATKYAMLKNFMLESGDDPEKDNIDFKPSEQLKETLSAESLYITKTQADHLHKTISSFNTAQRRSILMSIGTGNFGEVKKANYLGIISLIKSLINKEAKNANS